MLASAPAKSAASGSMISSRTVVVGDDGLDQVDVGGQFDGAVLAAYGDVRDLGDAVEVGAGGLQARADRVLGVSSAEMRTTLPVAPCLPVKLMP